MPTNPLTDADLAAIEARHTTTLDNGERVIDEDTAHLLAAVREARAERDEARSQAERAHSRAEMAIAARKVTLAQRDEARALVEALVSDEAALANGIPGGYIDWDDDRRVCTYCLRRWRHDESERHSDTCEVKAAREALAAWRGDGDE